MLQERVGPAIDAQSVSDVSAKGSVRKERQEGMRKGRGLRLPFGVAVSIVALLLLIITLVQSCSSHPVPHPRPVPTPTPIVTPTPMPQPSPGPVCVSPLIPLGQLPAGTRYSTSRDLKAMPDLTWHGAVYLKQPGRDGRLWGVPIGGGKAPSGTARTQVLLYGPSSIYCKS